MIKAKKILFLISGILKVVVSALGLIVCFVVLFLRKVFKELMKALVEGIKTAAEKLPAGDEGREILKVSTDELTGSFMSIITIIFVIMFLLSVSYMVFGIINIRLGSGNRYQSITKKKRIWLVVLSWLISFEIFTNTMTTVAIFLKDKNSIEDLYTQSSNDDKIIEVK